MRALAEHIPPPRRFRSRYGVRIQTPDPENFQKLTGTSLFNDTSTVKFSRRSDQFFPAIWAKLQKNSHLTMLKNPLKKSWLSLDEDDFQNLNSSSLSTDTSVVIFSADPISRFLHEVENRQTVRET